MNIDENQTPPTAATSMSNDFVAVAAQKTSNKDDEVDWKPEVDLLFNTLEEIWKCWISYGGKMGFNVRKQYFNKNKDGAILSARYVCSKEGTRKPDKRHGLSTNHRLETRTNCQVRIGIKYMKEIEKYRIHDVVDEHNHLLHLPETSHMLKSQRKLSKVQAQEIDLADDSGIKQRAVFELMSRQVGGRESLGYTRLDQKNYLRGKRLRNMAYGEAGSLLYHFQQKRIENPSFYHGVQLDVDEQITNIFWADARMIMDYEYFGDVVSLDTTYSTNNAYRPLAVFAGFNHFRRVLIFGAALLYDETTKSFKWLFEEFLKAHNNKRPQTVFTDQDPAMARALREVMPESYHGLCSWHLMQNGIKHLGNLMKNDSHFLKDFKSCMYKYIDEVDFQREWDKMVDDYNVKEDRWISNLYKIKEKWTRCYMKNAFTIGMRSTQLSESFNSDLKSCLKPDLDIIQFFKHFDRVVDDKRYNEAQCEFESRDKLPRLKMEHSPLLQMAAKVYTLPIFDLFQKEYDKYSTAYIKGVNEGGPTHEYLVSLYNGDYKFKVSFNPSLGTISCSCRKFESFGILCCHVIKILDAKDIKSIPDQYILKRWTRGAKNGFVNNTHERNVEEDPNLGNTHWYSEVCPKLVRIATCASDIEEARKFVDKAIEELSKQVDDIREKKLGLGDNNATPSSFVPNPNNLCLQVKGLKRRNGVKNFRKRPKSWVENQPKKTRRGKTNFATRNGEVNENTCPNNNLGVSTSQEQLNNLGGSSSQDLNNNQGLHNMITHESTYSFTSLLTAPLDDTFLQSLSVDFNQVPSHLPGWLRQQEGC